MQDLSQLTEDQLEDLLSEPSPQLRQTLAALEGDVAVLGAGGKMGPTLAMMLKKAAPNKNVFAVSRFSDAAVKQRLDNAGVRTVCADLLDPASHRALPQVPYVYYLVGMKFGSAANQPVTWAMNTFLPGTMAQHYKDSRLVVLSTGNVYPYVAPTACVTEDTPPDPLGEYAQSCLGRERICEYFSRQNGTPMTLIRLNYANEPRYGILVDLAQKIINGGAVDLTVPAVNLIWQRDANDYIARAITLAQSPPTILNVTGAETVSVRAAAAQIGRLLGKEPKFSSPEGPKGLLSDASRCFEQFGRPVTRLEDMISMIVSWFAAGKPTLNKPTKYEVYDGKF
ncbi:MAG TPA: NAD(P)-dependent oxidoreductase [Anaerohalosphaeraceae bacterium]|jgi:nucleoside-diphosphate-sugar epimerase|nr:NAD(P)-dependent oxidoreductase [Anaerohalosphaeraceae bacterium]HRT50354.1 NAD(P)-dependent oxidoreductase [Anaerohalosphaeraceae bacterium]HRT86285.1 NAD(P)-dependent oxidoreductase [Anaerohalosphaeraceae bacterium]